MGNKAFPLLQADEFLDVVATASTRPDASTTATALDHDIALSHKDRPVATAATSSGVLSDADSIPRHFHYRPMCETSADFLASVAEVHAKHFQCCVA